MNKLRMAFIDLCNFSDWPVGGMLQYERLILETLTKRFSVDLWGVSVDGDSPEPLQLSGEKLPIHTFTNVKCYRRVIPNYWKGLALCRYKKELINYDILYIHTGSCAVAATLRMKTDNNLIVYHQHGLQYLSDNSLKTLLQRPFMVLAQKKTDFSFVVTGPEELETYISSGREALRGKLIAIGSPAARCALASSLPKKDENEYRFIYVGRLAPIKRVPLLVEMFAQFAKKHDNNCRLDIVGDGEEHEAVEHAIAKNDLHAMVRLIGSVPAHEVSQYLFRADVFVTASAGEGTSLAVLEAFNACLPVVCFPVRGLREQVKNGETGAVADNDNAQSFVSAMEKAYNRRHGMAERCREEGKKHSGEAIGSRIAEEIEKRYGEDKRHHSGL